MTRNGFCIRRYAQQRHKLKNPNQLVDKRCAYILKVKRLRRRMNYDLKNIIAMDETVIWNDMISNTTVEKRSRRIYLNISKQNMSIRKYVNNVSHFA